MRSILAAVLIAIPLAASADEADIQIGHAWSRAAMAGHEGVVSLTITDAGTQDTLTGVTTPGAAKVEPHQSVDDHGVKMRLVATLRIEPGKPVTLAPDAMSQRATTQIERADCLYRPVRTCNRTGSGNRQRGAIWWPTTVPGLAGLARRSCAYNA
jgi:Copper chaperone PCu(A)C